MTSASIIPTKGGLTCAIIIIDAPSYNLVNIFTYSCEDDMPQMFTDEKKPCGTEFLLYGAVILIVRMIAISVCGAPYDMIHKLNSCGMIPPLWIWNLLSCILSFLAGGGAGCIYAEIGSRRLAYDRIFHAYKGAICFITSFFLSLIHFPLFFICEKLLLSLAVAVICSFCSLCCAYAWARVSKLSSLIMTLHSFWCVYTLFVTLCVFIKN